MSTNSAEVSNKIDLYKMLIDRTCQLQWQVGESSFLTSGCFVKIHGSNVQVLTCFHDISWKDFTVTLLQTELTCKISKVAVKHDLAILDVDGLLEETSHFAIATEPLDTLEPGTNVFFSGFPALKTRALVHRGCISSENNDHFFKIDASVLRGHSGSPLVFWDKASKAVTLIGIISSQIIDVSKKLIELSSQDLPMFCGRNDCPATYKGTTSVASALDSIEKDILANLNLGIGKVSFINNIAQLVLISDIKTASEDSVDVRAASTLTDEAAGLEARSKERMKGLMNTLKKTRGKLSGDGLDAFHEQFPSQESRIEQISDRVGEQHVFKVDVTGSYTINNAEDETESTEFTVSCQRGGKPGKGPRTVNMFVDDMTFCYRFPNPHGAKYNGNWDKFYKKAGKVFATEYQGPDAAVPDEIVFSIGKTKFVGKLE